MKFIYFTIICILLLGCKKHSLEATDPIIGKWAMEGISTFGKGSANYIGPNDYEGVFASYDSLNLGKLIVEIKQEGILAFNSIHGEETFRIVQVEKIESIVYTKFGGPGPSYIVSGYNLTIKNKKGKKFQFKYYYDPVRSRMIGVAWYKGVLYNTPNQPISNGKHFGITFHSVSLTSEYLGVFYKI